MHQGRLNGEEVAINEDVPIKYGLQTKYLLKIVKPDYNTKVVEKQVQKIEKKNDEKEVME